LNVEGSSATIEREIAGGKETLKVNFPFVASAAKGMAEARIPNIRGITAARTKPLQVLPAYQSEKLTSIKAYELPPITIGRRRCPSTSPNTTAYECDWVMLCESAMISSSILRIKASYVPK
jgi:hypothetical protein